MKYNIKELQEIIREDVEFNIEKANEPHILEELKIIFMIKNLNNLLLKKESYTKTYDISIEELYTIIGNIYNELIDRMPHKIDLIQAETLVSSNKYLIELLNNKLQSLYENQEKSL